MITVRMTPRRTGNSEQRIIFLDPEDKLEGDVVCILDETKIKELVLVESPIRQIKTKILNKKHIYTRSK